MLRAHETTIYQITKKEIYIYRSIVKSITLNTVSGSVTSLLHKVIYNNPAQEILSSFILFTFFILNHFERKIII